MLAIAVLLFALQAECDHLRTLYELRSLMTRSYASSYEVQRFADQRIDQLREPLRDGGHRWIRWARPAGDGPMVKREHTVIAVGDGRDRVEASGGQVFAARVVVPRKRSLIRENNPVWVGTAQVDYEIDGREMTKREVINQWMNPGTSRTIDLGGIAERASARLDASTNPRHAKQALVEIHLPQAVPEDDPANPALPTIRALQRIRHDPDPVTVDAEIAAAESAAFPGAPTLPLLTLIADLRAADELMRSTKPEEVEKGEKLLKETLRRLR
jgi:hypothetical protein